MTHKTYLPIIGLEVHIQLKTKSKMFCGCAADWFGKKPNTLTCPVCLGLPGALPVPNREAIERTIKLGLALNCDIARESKFDRKNYFYPDLPKGYQISQYDRPLCTNGRLRTTEAGTGPAATNRHTSSSGSARNNPMDEHRLVRIRRVHLEEDTAKLLHTKQFGNKKYEIQNLKKNRNQKNSLIDFNRSGVPLVEIVTDPDIRTSRQAVEFMKHLRRIVRYLGISDANMEEGSLRIEPNVSVLSYESEVTSREDRSVIHKSGAKNKVRGENKNSLPTNYLPSYKVEVKNINSFRFTKRAIDYEIERQSELLKKGQTPRQETRGYDEDRQETVSQRWKEEAQDYRYFPEPDIPPFSFSDTDLSRLKADIPELPYAKMDRYMRDYGLKEYHAEILTRDRKTAEYYELAAKYGAEAEISPIDIANKIINDKLNRKTISAKKLVNQMKKEADKDTMSEEQLREVIKDVLEENKSAVEDYRAGKTEALSFLVGQIMQKTSGKADPKISKRLFEQIINSKS